jgi:hypothetical protein
MGVIRSATASLSAWSTATVRAPAEVVGMRWSQVDLVAGTAARRPRQGEAQIPAIGIAKLAAAGGWIEIGRGWSDDYRPAAFSRHRFPAAIINHAGWLYQVFGLSLHDVELIFRRARHHGGPPKYTALVHEAWRRFRETVVPTPASAWRYVALDEMFIPSVMSCGRQAFLQAD